MRLPGNLSPSKQPYYFLRHINSSFPRVNPVTPGQKPHNNRPPLQEYFNAEEAAKDSNKQSSPYSEEHTFSQSMHISIYA